MSAKEKAKGKAAKVQSEAAMSVDKEPEMDEGTDLEAYEPASARNMPRSAEFVGCACQERYREAYRFPPWGCRNRPYACGCGKVQQEGGRRESDSLNDCGPGGTCQGGRKHAARGVGHADSQVLAQALSHKPLYRGGAHISAVAKL